VTLKNTQGNDVSVGMELRPESSSSWKAWTNSGWRRVNVPLRGDTAAPPARGGADRVAAGDNHHEHLRAVYTPPGCDLLMAEFCLPGLLRIRNCRFGVAGSGLSNVRLCVHRCKP
jgi:hypothetical protein